MRRVVCAHILAVSALLLCGLGEASAAGEAGGGTVYEGALYEPFIAQDHIGQTDNVEMLRGYYGYFDITNGQLKQTDASRPATLTSTPFNVCNPAVDWTALEWEGTVPAGARVTFALRGTVDDGLAAGFPDDSKWTDWVALAGNGNRLPIPGSLDGKQYLQYRVTLTGGAALTEVRLLRNITVPAHPRMLTNAAEIARAKERIASDPRIKAIFDQFIRHCDNALVGNADKRGKSGVWHAQYYGQALGLAYQLTGDRKYAEEAKIYLERLFGPVTVGGVEIPALDYSKEREFDYSEVAREMPAVYDLIYDTLTPAERTRYAQKLVEIAQFVEDTTRKYRFSDLCNQVYVKNVTFFMTGLALLGDGIADDKAQAWFVRADREFHERLIPASNLWASDDGGFGEGPGYAGFTDGPFLRELLSWRSATGEDLFAVSNFYRYLMGWELWLTRPHDGRMQRFNDSKFERPSISSPAFIASRYHNSRAQWLANRYLEAARKDSYSYQNQSLWQWVLWYDPDQEEETLQYPDQPLVRLFQGVGYVIFRSGWDTDATFAVLKCQSFRSFGHRHADENHFVITKRGALAIDSGVDQRSPSDHVRNYFTQTIAHNTITVYNPNEDMGGTANDGGQYRGELRKVSGDDPRNSQYGAYYPGSPLSLGGIVAFETNTNYSYACGDATRAYSPDKLTLFTRQMVYLPQNSFVIFDRVTSTKPEFAKRWLLHAVEEPVLAGRVAAVSQGGGRLFCQTLLPEDAHIELVGGPGKEFWVDGKNFPPPQPKQAEEAGAWRIEVSPGAPRTEDYFLHLLTTTSAETTKAPVGALVTEEGAVGLEFAPAGKSCRITFATEGKPAGHITIKDASGLVLLDQDLTQEVQPQRFMPEEEGKEK
jgi:hypothetical protein